MAERARNSLLSCEKMKQVHVKNWRPHYLAIGYVNENGKVDSPGIFTFLSQIRKGAGLAIYACVVKGEYNKESYNEAKFKEKELDKYLKETKANVFSKVIVSQSIEQGMLHLIQSSGLGILEPNTLMMAWPTHWKNDELKQERFLSVLSHALGFGHMLTVLKHQKEFDSTIKRRGFIDIWSFAHDKGVMFLMAKLLMKNKIWKDCTLRLFLITVMSTEEDKNSLQKVVRDYLDRYRLFERIEIIVKQVPPSTLSFYRIKPKKTDGNPYLDNNSPEKRMEFASVENRMKMNALRQKEDDIMSESLLKTNEIVKQAEKLNEIVRLSKDSDLLITNLPERQEGVDAESYLGFMESLTQGMDRCLFIGNPGVEVLT